MSRIVSPRAHGHPIGDYLQARGACAIGAVFASREPAPITPQSIRAAGRKALAQLATRFK